MKLPKGNIKIRLAIAKIWEKSRLLIIAAVALLVVVTVGGYGVSYFAERSEKAQQIAAEAAVKETVNSLNGALRKEFDGFLGLVNNSKLAPLFAADDRESLATQAEALESAHPAALKVRMLPLSIRQVDYATNPPLTYASLELMQRSKKKGAVPPPDAQLLGTDQGHLALLARVADSERELVGHVLFQVRPDLVQKVVDKVPFAGGYLGISQTVTGAKPVVLAKRGTRGEEKVTTKRLGGTGWLVSLRMETEGPVEPGAGLYGGVMLWAGLGLLILVLLGGGLFVVRKKKKVPEPAGDVLLGGGISKMADGTAQSTTEMVDAYMAQTEAEPPAAQAPLPEGADQAPDETMGAVFGDMQAEPSPSAGGEEGAGATTPTQQTSASIFRAYDIRGIVGKDLTAEVARGIGQAIGSEAYERGQQAVVVGRDGRRSSQEMTTALIEGLRASGRDVIDVGQVPTPVLYFSSYYLESESGVMVTGSHNPAEYNGFKIMLGGETLCGDSITAIRSRLESGNLMTGEGSLQSMEVGAEYIRRVSEDIPVALGNAYKLVVDCGNGVAGEMAPRLYRALGHDVIELYCDVDGTFPNHHPDPSQPENLNDLIQRVRDEQADLGLAFDGDGDRLGVVDGEGNIIWADRLIMFYAEDILGRNPGAEVIYDVKCSNRLAGVIEGLGGKPVMWKSGHSFIKQKMRETGAAVGGEMSGHFFIKERWYGFDDALYAGARLLELLRNLDGSPTQAFKKYTTGVCTPELRVNMAEGEHTRLMERLSNKADFAQGATVTDIDGVRADWPDGWGLVRASNTIPSLVLRFEGDDEAAMKRIQDLFRKALLEAEPGLDLPF